MRKIFTLFFCAASLATGLAQQESYFTNPVIHGDVADPSIIRIDQTYYITGTSSEWAPYYPVFTSTDLVNWQQTGHVFDEKPEWTKSSFWAPEWYQHKGKVYVYYTARKQSDNISCIGVAVADSPTGKFKDYGPVVEFGKEAIDAFILEDKGKLYISWKAYGLDNQPIELLACKLTDDGLRLDGKPFSLLRDDERQGMEGQHWFKKDGYYYHLLRERLLRPAERLRRIRGSLEKAGRSLREIPRKPDLARKQGGSLHRSRNDYDYTGRTHVLPMPRLPARKRLLPRSPTLSARGENGRGSLASLRNRGICEPHATHAICRVRTSAGIRFLG